MKTETPIQHQQVWRLDLRFCAKEDSYVEADAEPGKRFAVICGEYVRKMFRRTPRSLTIRYSREKFRDCRILTSAADPWRVFIGEEMHQVTVHLGEILGRIWERGSDGRYNPIYFKLECPTKLKKTAGPRA